MRCRPARPAGRAVRLLLAIVVALLVAPAVSQADGPLAIVATTCSDYGNQADAQRGADTRDSDGDGLYCEALPCPCLKPGGGGGVANPLAEQRRRAEARARRRAAALRRAAARRRARARARRRKAARQRRARRRLESASARIVEVIDGDTVRVRTSGSIKKTYTVRLLGVDSPETRHPNRAVECGGPEATSWMLSLGFTAATDSDGDGLLDRKGGEGVAVDLTTDPSQDLFDRFGRLLAYVAVPAGARGAGAQPYDLSRTIISLGYSRAYTFRRQVNRFPSYRQAESEARGAGRGVWSQCGGDFHSEA